MKRYERDDKKVLYYALDNGKQLIVQPHNSPICGQCAMAMIAGVTAREIVDQLFDPNGTITSQRDPVLAKYMDDVKSVLKVDNRKPIDLSGTGIIALQYGRSSTGHALAFENGVIYDPAGRVYDNFKELKADYTARGRKIRVHSITYATPRAYQQEVMAAQD